jgi:hypothetical protein
MTDRHVAIELAGEGLGIAETVGGGFEGGGGRLSVSLFLVVDRGEMGQKLFAELSLVRVLARIGRTTRSTIFICAMRMRRTSCSRRAGRGRACGG